MVSSEKNSSDSPPVQCERHFGQVAHLLCAQCNRPICRECVGEFGYFCSSECLEKARGSVTDNERAERVLRDNDLVSFRRKFRTVVLMLTAVLVLAAGLAVWRYGIAASGKVCWSWQHQAPLNNVRVFLDDDVLWVASEGQLVKLDSASGKPTSNWRLPENLDLDNLSLKVMPPDLLIHDGRRLVRLVSDRKTAFDIEFERPARKVLVGTHHAWVLLPEEYGANESRARSGIVCFSLETGDIIWRVEALPDYVATRLLATGEHLFAMEEPRTVNEPVFVRAFDGRTGSNLWQLTLTDPPLWGPVAAAGHLLFQDESVLHAVSTQGKEVWRVKTSPSLAPAHFVDANQIFVEMSNGTTCYDIVSGVKRWDSPFKLTGYFFMRLENRHLVASAYPPLDRKMPGLAGSEGSDQLGEILKDMGTGSADFRALMQHPVLVRLNLASGEVLWQSRKVLGELLTDGQRIVHVMASGNTSLLEMLADGAGRTLIEQYDLKSGSCLYSRHLDIGLVPSGVGGNRLVGIAYTRTERPGVASVALVCDGVVGIRLR